uniref:3-ketoacyl-CoA synthase n=1 Tax=Elaeis guineensis var. tenera TaxID=51953 RepID=A0A6I9RUQ5_ELAGV|nr:3-ketoacyl-CoA synthase 5-like [Elaeis guineensis]
MSMATKYFKLCYRYLFNNLLAILLVPGLITILIEVLYLAPVDFQKLSASFQAFDAFYLLFFSLALIVLATIYFTSRPRTIYLVDFACYKPPTSCRFPISKFMNHSKQIEDFEPSSIEFQRKILERSGLGEDTSLPPAHHAIPFTPTMAKSREESELVIFSIVDSLFQKTKVKPRDIDILVVNCSLFAPTPSLSAMIVNKYKMRSNIRSYNLSGMGCSAGIISIDLARDELLVHANSYALVVTTEIITEHWYTGNRRSMLLANCLFRMGGAAVLLSNKRREATRAKYELLHVVRTHKGADDRAYRCVYQEEDGEKKIGVSLSRDLTEIAGGALKANITTIGPLVLPLSEQVLFFVNKVGRRFANPKWRPYVPDFTKAFEHFCIHAGGRAVIEELGTKLRLSEEQTEASRMTLHRFGNTSSSSPWYELGYVEAKGRMRKGDRVWQIGLGSGFKCNSAVWRCRRSVGREEEGVWADCIDEYPVHAGGGEGPYLD